MTMARFSFTTPLLAISLLALTAVQAAAQQVGTTGAVNPAAAASGRVLQIGTGVLFKERITTTDAGSVQVIFIDKTTLNVGPNSDMLIDEFVYDPKAGTGRMTATLTKGVLRVVGGNVTHTGGATVRTPAASIGVRGGVATISHQPQTGTQAINHFGRLEVSSANTTQTISRPGFAVNVAAPSAAPTPPARAEAPAIAAAVSNLTSKPGQTGGTVTSPTDSNAQAASLGATNAQVTAATTPTIQAQTASQAVQASAPVVSNFTTTVTPAAVEQTVQQVVQQTAAQPTAPPPVVPPSTAFYALRTTGVPFLSPAFMSPGVASSMIVSDLYGYRRGGLDPTTGAPRYGSGLLQVGFGIDGTGESQTSSFFVMNAAARPLNADGTSQFIDAGFTATTRIAGVNVSLGRSAGSADSIAGTEVLSSDKLPTAFTLSNDNRVSADGTTQAQTAFYFLGNSTPSQNYMFANAYSAVTPPSSLGNGRYGDTLYGAVIGVARTFHAANANAGDSSVGRSFIASSTLVLQFDTDAGRLQANAIDFTKDSNSNGDPNEFQSASLQAGSLTAPRGRGTFIDSRTFAAREAVLDPLTSETPNQQISTTNGQTLTRSRQAFAVSDTVNGNAILTQLAPGVTPCVCEYTRWGAWSFDNARTNLDGSEERDRMHVGWWLAGRLTDPVQIPTTGSAAYNGHMVGTVKNSATGAEYIAASGFQYNANFGNPAASTMSVNSFDGVSYGGTLPFDRNRNTNAYIANPSIPAAIEGTIPRTGGAALTSATMEVGGMFFKGVTDPVKDVAGGFSVRANPVTSQTSTQHNYIAAGAWAGSR